MEYKNDNRVKLIKMSLRDSIVEKENNAIIKMSKQTAQNVYKVSLQDIVNLLEENLKNRLVQNI